MGSKRKGYIPALNRRWLTPLYDPLLRYLMREGVFKPRMIEQAGLRQEDRVLDLACGTGTLTVMIQAGYPRAKVVGLDIDSRVLRIAAEKAASGGWTAIRWAQGSADVLPFRDGAFDLVFASLMVHHLNSAAKSRTFMEIRRVLSPRGRLVIADFGPPRDGLMRAISIPMSRLEHTADLFQGRIPALLYEAGFEAVIETELIRTVFGPLYLYRAASDEITLTGAG